MSLLELKAPVCDNGYRIFEPAFLKPRVIGRGNDSLSRPALLLRELAFFFYCIAELAIKPCRSSRSNTRGGFEKIP